MCRGKETCSELGTNPKEWSKSTPLQPPVWFNNELSLFSKAVTYASTGKLNDSLQMLLSVRSNDLRQWFVEHGQMSGVYRTRILKISPIKNNNVVLDPLRSPGRYSKEVFKRDSYTCQYCGIGVIPKEILSAFSKVVGISNFRPTGTNNERHGAILAFRANADHVDPYTLGGRTNPENLVTSCWSCNYGKSSYTLKELGLNDPRNKSLKVNNWDGLVSLMSGLKDNAV